MVMRRLLPLLAVLIAACSPQTTESAAKKKQKPPEMRIEVTQSPEALAAAESGELQVQVVPPEGIALNRYPGITLAIEDAAGLKLDSESAFVGVDKPLSDPDEFQFEKIDPLRFKVTAPDGAGADGGSEAAAKKKMTGTLKFFYCRKKDGFCAPASQKVSVPVKVR
jgi:hypothetical protein